MDRHVPAGRGIRRVPEEGQGAGRRRPEGHRSGAVGAAARIFDAWTPHSNPLPQGEGILYGAFLILSTLAGMSHTGDSPLSLRERARVRGAWRHFDNSPLMPIPL